MKEGLLLPVFLCIFIVSMSCSANASNQKKYGNLSVSEKMETTSDTLTELEVIDTASEDTNGLVLSFDKTSGEVSKLTSFTSIEKLHFPLPEKYRYYISSSQGLRESIPNVNAGGGATLSTYHNAIDFAVPDRTPVYAAKSGYVQTVYPSYYNGDKWKGHPQYGGLIEIKHEDGTITLYAHLSYTEVREGSYVTAGDEIGWSGGKRGRRGSGNSTGPHLHFSEYVDINNQFI